MIPKCKLNRTELLDEREDQKVDETPLYYFRVEVGPIPTAATPVRKGKLTKIGVVC